MAEEGTFCINADVIKKAGANVSATSIAEAFTNNYIKQAEGRIMDLVRVDLRSNYAGINVETKDLLREASSNLAAVYAIQFDMGGFTSRIEAEDMINVLTFNFREALKILGDQKTITYSDVENGEILGMTIREVDSDPLVSNVDTIVFPNGTVTDDGGNQVTITVSGTGDVVGPASAVDGNIVLFDGVTGKLIKDGLVAVSAFMQDVIDDTTPQLGGNLDIQAFNIETAVAADFVKLAGLTSSAAELNVLDGIPGTLTATEIGYSDGVTSSIQTQLNAKGDMNDLVDDTTPQLGGELDAQANSIGFTAQSATGDGATTIDWGNGNKFNFAFGAFNETFTFTSPAKPGNFLLKLVQDGTGSRTATWPATVKWPSGTAPTLSTAASSVDIISFYYDGTNYYGNSSLAFS